MIQGCIKGGGWTDHSAQTITEPQACPWLVHCQRGPFTSFFGRIGSRRRSVKLGSSAREPSGRPCRALSTWGRPIARVASLQRCSCSTSAFDRGGCLTRLPQDWARHCPPRPLYDPGSLPFGKMTMGNIEEPSLLQDANNHDSQTFNDHADLQLTGRFFRGDLSLEPISWHSDLDTPESPKDQDPDKLSTDKLDIEKEDMCVQDSRAQ